MDVLMKTRDVAWTRSSFNLSDHHILLDSLALEELSEWVSEDQPAGYTPRSGIRNADMSRLQLTIRNLQDDFLEGWPGYCIVRGVGALDRSSWASAFRLLSLLLGNLLPQDGSGLLLKEVKDRGTKVGEGVSSRFSDSRYGGVHTDGAEVPFPLPDYFGLLCVNRAPRGGSIQLLSAAAVYRFLEVGYPSSLAMLRQPFHFDRRGDLGPNCERTIAKPVFFSSGTNICATYLREYINIGHSHPEAPGLTEEQVAALNTLDAMLQDPRLKVEGYLNPGEAIFINNLHLFHGRTMFEDHPEPDKKRLMLRTWISARH
jgi:hypothetical protein